MVEPTRLFYFGRAVWRSLAMVALLLVVYVIIGRQLAPMVSRTVPVVESYLSEWLQQPVSIGSIQGEWRGFGPVFTVREVSIGDHFDLDNLVLEPALIASLVKQDLIFFRLVATGASLDVERIDGRWQVPAFLAFESDSRVRRSLLQIYDQLLAQDSLQFRNIELHLSDGQQTLDILLADVFIISSSDQHAVRGDLIIDPNGQSTLAGIQLEARNTRTAPDLRLYFEHERLDVSDSLTLLGLSDLASQFGVAQVAVAGEWWLDWRDQRVQSVQASLNSGAVQFWPESLPRQQELQQLQAVVRWQPGSEHDDETWDIDNLSFLYNEALWSPSTHQLVRNADSYRFTASRLNLQTIGEIVQPWMSFDLFNRHNLDGELTNFFVHIPTNDDGLVLRDIEVSGELAAGRFDADGNFPGFQNVEGRFQAGLMQGELVVSSSPLQVQLPRVMPEDFFLHAQNATVGWRVSDHGDLSLATNDMSLVWQGVGQLRGRLAASLGLTANSQLAEPVLALSLAGERLDADSLSSALPLALNTGVQRWIRDNVHFLDSRHWAVALPNVLAPDVRTVTGLITADVERANVRFHPEWPDVASASGRFWMDHRGFEVHVDSASFANIDLSDGRVRLPFTDKGAVLYVETPLAGQANDGWRVVTDTPLRELLSPALLGWFVEGETMGHLSLAVPFSDEPIYADVQLDIKDGTLVLPDQELAFSALNGPLSINSVHGLHSSNIRGQFFGEPLQVGLQTLTDPAGNWVFDFSADGSVPVNALGDWLDNPLLATLNGKVAYQGSMRIVDGWPTFNILSDLVGLEIPSPRPIGKSAEEARPLQLVIETGEAQGVSFAYGQHVQGEVRADARWNLTQGAIGIGRPPRAMEQQRLLADLVIDELDADAWWQEIQRIREVFRRAGTPMAAGESGIIAEATVRAERTLLLGQTFNQMDVAMNQNTDGLTAQIRADEVRGIIGVSGEPGDPMVLILDYLNLRTEQADETEQEHPADDVPPPAYAYDPENDPFSGYEPSDLPPMQVELRRLLVNDVDFGYWSFDLENDASRVSVRNLAGIVRHVEVDGEMDWRFAENNRQSTHLTLNVRAGNIARFLQASDYTPIIDSQSFRGSADVSWPGSPLYFAGQALVGSVNFNMRNGAIYEMEEFDSIKLIGLMNVTRIFRRLSLDFRDVLNAGFSYDQVTGDLVLNQGLISVGNRLVLDGSGAKMFFNGSYSVPDDALDAEGVIIARVTNAAGLVALGAGVAPPVALLVIFGERAFERELERLFSVRTEITGSIRDPRVVATRLFDSNIRGNDATIEERVRELFGPELRSQQQ
ncbi:hypothetical protein NFC81_10155 [Salinispirillum sp. LH 10-3-1]|uniref:YhdP central domain-containing protein n=1 Tax=Salinispirillum sp. LH 10-3-1 TaxID=2952525 RepID=A0AB38YD43_9GAMM